VKGASNPLPEDAMRSKLTYAGLVVAMMLAAAGCATFHPPTLQVQNIGKGRVGLSGVTLDVVFNVRNPNEQDIRIDRIEYELEFNGRHVGRGFVPRPVEVRGYGQERVTSEFDVNFLSLPGAIKDMLTRDRVRARASGYFVLRKRPEGKVERVHFSSDADVNLRNR
jgi:LEA14-like dessication related protein